MTWATMELLAEHTPLKCGMGQFDNLLSSHFSKAYTLPVKRLFWSRCKTYFFIHVMEIFVGAKFHFRFRVFSLWPIVFGYGSDMCTVNSARVIKEQYYSSVVRRCKRKTPPTGRHVSLTNRALAARQSGLHFKKTFVLSWEFRRALQTGPGTEQSDKMSRAKK